MSMKVRSQVPLSSKSDSDFVLKPNWHSCWLSADNASIHLWRSQGGLEVEVHHLHRETDEPIAGISVPLPDLALEE